MKTKNRIDLIGFVGQEPETRRTGDRIYTRFTLATTERWTDDAGAKHEHTDWHRVVFWGRAAEQVAKYVHKGSFLEVEGTSRSSTYEKAGARITAWEVRGFDFRLLDRRAEGTQVPDSPPPSDVPANDAPPPPPSDDDIPF
jgi:single-strand DNA-binding protein